jgi:signal transduction histidine kinase
VIDDHAPRHARYFGRHPWIRDVLIAVLVGWFQVAGTNFAAQHHQSARPLDAIANILLALGPFALIFRRKEPIAVLGIVFAITFAYRMGHYPEGPLWLALIIAFVTAVGSGPRWLGWVTISLGYLALLWGPSLAGRENSPSTDGAIAIAAWLLVLLAGAEFARIRRERRLDASHARELETSRRVTEERLRIARELHDVLAHNISLINVRAGVALHLIDEQPEQVAIALQTIKQASKETLAELRSVLGVLRQVDEGEPRAPAPSIDRLGELVERSQNIGITVRTEISGTVRPLPAGVDLAAYRIVQEALTNVAKHAGNATVRIALEYGPAQLTISVEDDGAGAVEPPAPGGNGIAGMRERATSLGGTLETGPLPGRGYRVRATMPTGGES